MTYMKGTKNDAARSYKRIVQFKKKYSYDYAKPSNMQHSLLNDSNWDFSEMEVSCLIKLNKVVCTIVWVSGSDS